MEFVSRIFSPPDDHFFLFGPRGTGKSTLLQLLYPEATTIDLLQHDVFRRLSARPETLEELLLAKRENTIVIIDEIQKLPILLDVVHRLIEMHRGWRFIMTGSSSRKLKRSGVDLLAGRALKKTLSPFIAHELGKRFDLAQALHNGLLPIVLASTNPGVVLNSYTGLYLKEEVQAEGLVRNIGNFSRFLETMSFSHGAEVSMSAIARDCEVGQKLVTGHLTILEDLLLGWRIPVFAKKARRQTTQHPKFYFFDTGVYRSLRPSGPLDDPESIEGAALEGLVAQHLKAWIDYRDQDCSLSFWRTSRGTEVDFVLYGPDHFYCIEVKNSRRVRSEDLKGLKTFCQDYPQAKPLLLYRGRERLLIAGVLCLSCESFLLNLDPHQGINSATMDQ